MNKIIALVGMCGSGKSEVANQFIARGYYYIRFGQITIDEIIKRGLEINEENERSVREEFRKQHGMAAFAILNIPKIEQALHNASVIVDGLYSWAEYKVIKEKYGDNLTVIAVYSSPSTRYARLETRGDRPIVKEQAKSRDYTEIENSEKGGPIAMADYTIVNEGNLDELRQTIKRLVLSQQN